MRLIDTHCHLDFDSYDGQRDTLVQEAAEAGVTRIINPGASLDRSRAAVGLAARYPGVYAAVGVHPNSTADWSGAHLDALRALAAEPKVIAIGEIGLDYHWDDSPRETQWRAFEAQLALAAELALPVIMAGIRTAAVWVIGTATLSTPIGQQASLDQQVTQIEGFGQTVDDAMYEQLKGRMKYTAAISAVAILVASPVITVVFAAVLFGVFSGALGGHASFRQVFAVLAHTSVVSLLQAVFVTPLNYVRESLSSATSLGVFLPMLAEGSFLANVLGAIDLFVLWSLTLTAIGLAVLYRRRSTPIFISLAAAYVVIALGIAAVKAALGGS